MMFRQFKYNENQKKLAIYIIIMIHVIRGAPKILIRLADFMTIQLLFCCFLKLILFLVFILKDFIPAGRDLNIVRKKPNMNRIKFHWVAFCCVIMQLLPILTNFHERPVKIRFQCQLNCKN